MEAPICITPNLPKIETEESLWVAQENKKYLLKVKIINDNIIFQISEPEELWSQKYTKEMTLNEIKQKEPQQLFLGLKSCNEFISYLKELSEMKRLSIIKNKEKLTINFTAEYFVKKYKVNIDLYPEKINLEEGYRNIYKEIILMKEKIKSLENENKNLINENKELKKEIEEIKKDNISLKDEINEIKKNLNTNKIGSIWKDSVIMEEKDFNLINKAIKSTLNKEIKGLKKLYQATVDGGDSKIFHEKCDNINNVLVIIKSEENKRFGGFSPECFECFETSCKSKNGKNSFLFSFDKQKIYPNINEKYGIWCNYGGPSFGCDEIFISGNPLKDKKLLSRCFECSSEEIGYNYYGDKNPFIQKKNLFWYLNMKYFKLFFHKLFLKYCNKYFFIKYIFYFSII